MNQIKKLNNFVVPKKRLKSKQQFARKKVEFICLLIVRVKRVNGTNERKKRTHVFENISVNNSHFRYFRLITFCVTLYRTINNNNKKQQQECLQRLFMAIFTEIT